MHLGPEKASCWGRKEDYLDHAGMLKGSPQFLGLFGVACVLCVVAVAAACMARVHAAVDLNYQVESLMRQDAHLCEGCKYYTPNSTHFKACPADTLKCFSEELEVLLSEWEIQHKPWDLQEGLLLLAEDQTRRGSRTCSPCELHPQKAIPQFLGQLLRTLQQAHN
ncbi:interleukin 15, like isoform X2 [Stigmatopora nigra]